VCHFIQDRWEFLHCRFLLYVVYMEMYSTYIHLCHIFSVYIRETGSLNQSDSREILAVSWHTHSEPIELVLLICKNTIKHADKAVAGSAPFKNMFKGNTLIKILSGTWKQHNSLCKRRLLRNRFC